MTEKIFEEWKKSLGYNWGVMLDYMETAQSYIDFAEYYCKQIQGDKKMSNETKERDLFNDKVEISAFALIEIKRAFGALLNDENSYINKTFGDDYVFHAISELKKTYAEYYDEPVKKWGK
jgi:hypothetical protein